MLKVLLLSVMVFAAREHGAHEHGAGQMSLAFDGKKGKIQLSCPGESLFGFEHEAKSAKDKKKKEEALKKLEEKIGEMVVLDPASHCEIKKDIFEVDQQNSHATVNADFNVTCQGSVVGSTVIFNFAKIFPQLKKVQVDLLAEGVQKSLEVKKNGDSLGIK